MHPAVSVILFTVLSGAGFGLMMALGLGLPVEEPKLYRIWLSVLAIALSVSGLVASTFHLGHPERAWRAFSQWRTSWLSREGVLSVVTLSCFSAYAFFWIVYDMRLAPLGFVSAFLALVTVVATAMIYAQLKTVPMWNTRLTPLCYVGFSIGSGLFLISAFAPPELGRPFVNLICGMTLMMWAAKMKWWQRAKEIGFRETESSVATATGLGHLGEVRLLERPHTGENYLTREMVHQIGRKHAEKLRRIAIGAGAVLPFLIAISVMLFNLPQLVLLLGFLSLMVGLFTERWLFFAEAKHSVSLYY